MEQPYVLLIIPPAPRAGGWSSLSGRTLTKTGGVRTNDQFATTGALDYGGTLVVTNLSAAPFMAGDSFRFCQADPAGGGGRVGLD
jgi:hypothetical protein